MHVQSIHSELKQLRLANLEEYFKNIPEKEWKPFMKPEVLFIEEYSYLLDLTRELA
jgi:hypothetical protein